MLKSEGLMSNICTIFHYAVNLCIAALHVLAMVILPCHTLDINSCLSFSVFQILAVLLPILGLGAFIWWAGRDIVQSAVRELNLQVFTFPHLSYYFNRLH